MSDRAERIAQILKAHFDTDLVTVRDDSAAHAGHAGAASGAGHFWVRIETAAFHSQSLLARHRAVYAALASMMPKDIHALSIEAISPTDALRPLP